MKEFDALVGIETGFESSLIRMRYNMKKVGLLIVTRGNRAIVQKVLTFLVNILAFITSISSFL